MLVEITSKDIQGPDLAKEFIGELTQAVGLDGDRPLLLDLAGSATSAAWDTRPSSRW